MNRKYVIIILLVIIALLACGIAFMFFNSYNVEFETLQLSNSCAISVPVSDGVEKSQDSYGISYYMDSKYELSITSFNSAEGATLPGAVQMATIRDSTQLGCNQIIENGTTIYQNPNTGVYSVFVGNNDTHDNILITAKDKDLLMKVLGSIKYSEVSNATMEDDGSNSSSQSDSSRYIEDEYGLYDTVTGKYVGGQMDGLTREEAAEYDQYLWEQEHCNYDDDSYYDDYYDDEYYDDYYDDVETTIE